MNNKIYYVEYQDGYSYYSISIGIFSTIEKASIAAEKYIEELDDEIFKVKIEENGDKVYETIADDYINIYAYDIDKYLPDES